jgi:general secretion pathway protein D
MGAPRAARRAIALLVAAVLLAGCAAGERARREGMSLVDEGKYEEGLGKLQEAVKLDPDNPVIRRDFLSQREQLVNRLLNAATAEREGGRFDSAEALYNRALGLNPNSEAAKQGLTNIDVDRRHAKLLNDAEALAAKGDIAGARALLNVVLVENPDNDRAAKLRYKLDAPTLKEDLAGPTLNIKGRKPVTLQFRDANLKMVLEAISRTTGVNILVDKDVRNDLKVTIFVKDTPVEQTLDLILLQNQLEKRVLGDNTVLIYPNNPAKAKDYQELKVRRFALTDADPKQVQSMLKTILKTKDIFVDEKTSAVVIRDTPEAVRLAERLVAAMDKPDAEVMLEVDVMDIDRSRALALGLQPPTDVTWTMLPIDTTAKDSIGNNTYPVKPNMFLSDLKNINSHGISVSSSSNFSFKLQALKTDKDTTDLATPRIRVRNKEKAKILIGQRLAVITSQAQTSVLSGTTTTGTSTPIYNQNIQYIEAGIKLEVEPTIHPDGEVAIKLNLEVSTPTPTSGTTGGTVAYDVTTNNVSTVLRLKDGETQLMGGLIRATDSENASKVPGLGDIPLLGKLFGIQQHNKDKHEIVLAITPRIVSNNQVNDADLLELWSGTESNLKFGPPDLAVGPANGMSTVGAPAYPGVPPVVAAPRPPLPAPAVVAPAARSVGAAGSPPTAAVANAARAGVGAVAAMPGPAVAPMPAAPGAAAPVVVPSGTVPQAAVSPVAALAPVRGTLQAELGGPPMATVGDRFNVAFSVGNGAPVNSVAAALHYDPAVLRAVAVTEGDLMRRNNLKSNFDGQIDEGTGTVTLQLTAEGGMATGGGVVASVQFEAVAAGGPAPLSATNLAASGVPGATVTLVAPPPLALTVQAKP